MDEVTGNSTLDRQHVAATLSSIISSLLAQDVGEVSEDTELEGQLGLDSIHRVELSTRISKTYGISVGVDDLDIVDLFGELIDAVMAANSRPARGQAE